MDEKTILERMSKRVAVFTSDVRVTPADVERQLGTLPPQSEQPPQKVPEKPASKA